VDQTTMAGGLLLTASVQVAPGAPSGPLSIPMTSVVYADPWGNAVPAGAAGGARVTLVSPQVAAIRVFPNPWRADKHAATPKITFDNLPANSEVKLFTVSGHLVKSLSPQASPANTAFWDLTNDSGDKVASGLYAYLITDDQGNKTKGMVAVVK
jgi:hypothetical protein